MKEKATIIRIASLFLIMSLFTIRRDGYFPIPESFSESQRVWMQALEVSIVVLLIGVFFFAERFVNSRLLESALRHLKPITITIIITYIVLTCLLLYHDAITYEQCSLPLGHIVAFGGITLLLIIPPFIMKRHMLSLYGLFLGSFLLFLVPILYFPITAWISDLLPIIREQLNSFMTGENMYQYYMLDNGILTQTVRQPGTTLSYLIAYITDIDLRFMSVVFSLLTGFVMIKFYTLKVKKLKFNSSFQLFYLLLAQFLLFPYLHLRHDLYDPFFWFLLSLALLLLYRSKLIWFLPIWALGIITQVWSWIFTPFIGVFLIRYHGIRKGGLIILSSTLVGIVLLFRLIWGEIPSYYEHIFEYYQNLSRLGFYEVNSIHLTPLFHLYGVSHLILITQILACGIIGIISIMKLKNFKHLLVFLIITFFVFLQFSILVWNYMFITMFVLMIIYTISEMMQLKAE